MTSKMHNDVMNGLNQTGSTNITSLIVRERLKHCVLNKRKSKEQGIGIVGSTSSMTGMIQPVNTKDNPSDKDVCQDSKTITSELVKLNQVKNESDDYIITDKCIDYNQNVMSDCIITPLIGDIENVPSGSHKSLSNQITSSLSSLNTNNSNNNNKVNIFNQTQPYHFSQESDPNYVNFQSLQTSIIGANVCSNLIIQHNSLHNHHHHHPHHHQQQQQHKVTGENLRKTVSEPSLKMRSGSGGVQKSRYKPDRRYFSANSATAAVAAATIAVSNDPLSVVSLWPQLTSAFQHANDLTELSQQDTTMSDVNHSTDNHDELHEDLNKNNHIFPYRRHQSIGLLSRTRSAPLSLAVYTIQ